MFEKQNGNEKIGEQKIQKIFCEFLVAKKRNIKTFVAFYICFLVN